MSRSDLSRGLIALAAFSLAVLSSVSSPPVPSRPESPSSQFEERDDAGGRDAYELLRLRDPRTGEIPSRVREKELAYVSAIPTRDSEIARRGLAKGTGTALIAWTRRGPDNIGGRTRALAIDVDNASVYLAGGVSGGMWRSTNKGVTWTKTTTPAQLHSVTCIAQDKRAGKRSTWYYGTGEYRGNSASGGGASYSGDGIFKSTDSGLSWSVLPITSTGNPHLFDNRFDYVFSIATDPAASSDIVYVARAMGVDRSTNGGSTWGTVLGGWGNSYPRYTDVAITSTGVIYAAMSDIKLDGSTLATGRGIYRSTDGVTWTPITPAGFPSQYSRIVIGIAPSNESVVYFLVATTNGTNGVDQINGHQFWKYAYISGDGSGAGGSWSGRGQYLPNESGVSGNAQFDTQSSYDMLVQVKPDNPEFVLVGGTNLYRSIDGFATATNWKRIGGYGGPSSYAWYANHHPDLHSGAFSPTNPNEYISGHDGGISATANLSFGTVAWSTLNNGYGTTQYYTVALEKTNTGNPLIVGGMQDNGTWFVTNMGNAWGQMYGGDGAACAIVSGSANTTYYASAQNGVVYRFLYDADTPTSLTGWTRVDPTGGANYLFINPFCLEPSNPKIMYLAAGPSLWKNSDLTGIALYSGSTTATNWTNLTAAGTGTGQISALSPSVASPSGRLYYGTSAGAIFRLDGAPAATAASAATNISAGKGLPAGYVSSLAVDPSDGNRLLAVYSNYAVMSLYLTTDGGTTWTAVGGNLEQNTDGSGNGPSCRSAVIVPAGATKTYFVGTSTGLYSTQNLAGTSTVWTLEGASTIGNVVVDQLDARSLDGVVAVATHGGGVYTGTVTATGVEEETLPVGTALEQNYPNPFNPSTTIRFRLGREGDVLLRIHDVSGRVVTELARGRFAVGEHSVIWNPAGIASGTYLCTLSAGGTSLTRKLLYVR